MCRYDDGEHCEVWIETRHRARKQHQCFECNGKISPGENYWRIFLVFEGEPDSKKVCDPCYQACKLFIETERAMCDESPGWMLGTLWDDIRYFAEQHLTPEALAEHASRMAERAKEPDFPRWRNR